MANPIHKLSVAESVSAQSDQGKAVASSGGAAFQALLERLDTQARELRTEASRVASTDELSQAVDHAHESLKEALQLSEQIVEAWRQNKLNSPARQGEAHS
jgi:histidinol dehydrogenase